MKQRLSLYKIVFLLGLLTPTRLWAQFGDYRDSISKEFNVDEKRRKPGFEILNRNIQNRAIASTLSANANEINRGIDSIMESLFYSVMDQSWDSKFSDTLSFGVNYERDVETTGIGTHVVIDYFKIGPDILKGLGEIGGLPLTFRNQNKLILTNLTYRSDALRAAKTQAATGWREKANNWFGVIPFLSGVLPPSFNPEELYDPIGYLGTPFLFPKSAEDTLEMPLGNIRSYGLSGSAGVSLDLVGQTVKDLQEDVSLGDLTLALPISGFLEAEHRISVLHANQTEVWLAVTEIRQLGSLLDLELGKRYQLFRKLVNWWTGGIATIAPVDFELERAKIFQIDELYSFDTTKPESMKALNEALNGKLGLARAFSHTREHSAESGVTFEFKRFTTRSQDTNRQGQSLFVLQSQRQNQVSDGESVINDNRGEYVTLEAQEMIQNRDWNVLVGAETVNYDLRFSLPVMKKIQQGKASYRVLDTNEPNYFIASLKIIDSFHDSRDYQESIALLRRFSNLPIVQAPEIPTHAEDLEARYFREQAFGNPMDTIYRKDVPTTHLGRFEGLANVYIPHERMRELGSVDEQAFWAAYAKACGVDPNYWASVATQKQSGYYLNRLTTYSLMPLRVVNLQTEFSDYVYEGDRILGALRDLHEATDPLKIVQSYRRLMDTNHPAQLLNVLSELAKPYILPTNVSLKTSADENRDDTPETRRAKEAFAKLNSQVFRTPSRTPDLKRNQTVEEKLQSFAPGGYQVPYKTPELQKITISLLPGASVADSTIRCVLQVESPDTLGLSIPLRAYVRVEQAGPLSLGRFVLTEEIKTARLIGSSSSTHVSLYEIDLNGENGLVNSKFFADALKNAGAFDVFFTLSDTDETWGQEQKISFDIQGGLIREL